jgi:hypothetical protein
VVLPPSVSRPVSGIVTGGGRLAPNDPHFKAAALSLAQTSVEKSGFVDR